MRTKKAPARLFPGSRVAAYLRDSGGGKQDMSTRDQLKAIKEYCQKNDFVLVETHIFEDVARSGTSIQKRQEFQRMIYQCVEDNLVQGLLIWDMTRFARNLDDAQEFKSRLRRHGIVVKSLNDSIPEGRVGQVIEYLQDWRADEASEQISRDTIRGLAERTREGYVPGGGTPPRGYQAVRKIISYHRDGSPRIGTKWKIDPKTGPLVSMAFKMRAQGKSLQEIMRAPCGSLYKSKSCWTTFFRNKSYLGIGKCGKTEVPNHHPALVDLETWEAVRELHKKIHARSAGNPLHPKRYHSPSLLSGIAICIHCGTPIIREVCGAKATKTGKWIAYLCGKKRNTGNWHACEGKQIQAAKADAAILDAVLNKILREQYANDFLKYIRDHLADESESLRQEKATRQALTNCERAISNLLDAVESGNLASAKERLKEREQERSRLQFELITLEARRKAAKLEVTPEALSFYLDIARGEIEAAREQNDIRSLQNLLRKFVSKIELGKGFARVWYTYRVEALADSHNNGSNESRLKDVSVRDRRKSNVFKYSLLRLFQFSLKQSFFVHRFSKG